MPDKKWGGCWAESYCSGYPRKCDWLCVGFVQLSNIYELSGIPKRYQRDVTLTLLDDTDRKAYLYLKDWMVAVDGNVGAGRGLYIVSKNKGNGKTAWACKIMNEYFKNVALRNDMRCRGLFVNVPTFLQELRGNMDNPSEDVERKLANIASADLVIWDDIGTEVPSNWVRERLYGFINGRYSENKSQIFTSNMYLEELAKETYMGERIVSRIIGQCDVVEFLQQDRRAD